MQPATFPTVFRQNPKIVTHTGQASPYGYMDWWPISLYVNNERPPFGDKDVRWALSYYLDRSQLIEVGYLGANTPSKLPLPPYPPLLPYFDAVKDLLAKYDTNEFAPKKGDGLLAAKGFKKDGEGFGRMLRASGSVSMSSASARRDRRSGRCWSRCSSAVASKPACRCRLTSTAGSRRGNTTRPFMVMVVRSTSPTRHCGSTRAASIAVPGAHQANFARWKNPEYDKLVDEAYVTAPDDTKKLSDIWRRAMEIWLPELPDIQLVQNYHRIPWNTTYWKNWPTEENAYVNGAHWHLTFPMVLWSLQRA